MKRQKNLLHGVAAVLMALCMVCTLAVTTFAASTTNTYVTNDTTGVLQVRLRVTDKNNTAHDVQWGTGFLINDNTLITCYHVLSLTDSEASTMAESLGMTLTEFKDRLYIEIVVLRDVTVTASIINFSDEMDFAILSLDTAIYNRTYLTMRPTSEVQQTETVYALGFPGVESTAQDAQTYTSDDVTITSGVVNKLTTYNTIDYVMHTATLTSGNSGGPLVDAEGNVIGICQGGWSDGMDVNYYYSIANDELIDTLEALGIEFTLVDEVIETVAETETTVTEDVTQTEENNTSTETQEEVETVDKTELSATITDAQKLDEDDYTSDSWDPFSTALTNAQNVYGSASATQNEVNSAVSTLTTAQSELVEKTSLPIIPIAAGAVVLVVVIIVIVVVSASSKKKKKAAPTPMEASPYAPVSGGFNSVPATPASSGFTPVSSAPSAGETSVLSNSAGETTLLGSSAGETTLLGGNASLGKLTRTKTGETISINNANFVIGREKSQVNYCVADNSSVGRKHAKISGHGGAVYLTDLKSTNGTFINGVKQNPNQEVQLNNGDKITLADEEFVYSSF